MKTLANCTPREFLKQTNRIRKAVANWLSLTKILDIRKKLPTFKDGMSAEDKRKAAAAQIQKNGMAMLDAILDEHPEETAELLGLMCFIEPEELDNHQMREFFGAFADMLNCPEIVDFFYSLARLENVTTSDAAKA